MNTVLDDNKKLCLVSGEIIRMSNSMTMFFEAEDLEQASPATVSRVGMIFCETRNIGWEAIRNIWLNTITESHPAFQHIDFIKGLFNWLFSPITYFVTKYCHSSTNSVSQELVFSLIRVFKSLLDFDDGVGSDMTKVLEGCFIYSLIWSVGCCIDNVGRKKFDEYLRLFLLNKVADSSLEYQDFLLKNPDYEPDTERKVLLTIPDSGVVYDYMFDSKTVKWINWLEMPNSPSQNYKIPADAKFNSIVIPTIDTIRNEWLLHKLLIKGHHVLCTGDTGTGEYFIFFTSYSVY